MRNCWSAFKWSFNYGSSNLLEVARSTVSAIMTAYTKKSKTTSSKPNSGRKSKLADRHRRVLKHIVAQKHKQSLSEITFEMNSHFQDPISTKTLKREIHAANIYGRIIRKTMVTATNAFKRCQWCRDHKGWSPQQGK
ncbi:transposable element Tcb1 transposase [Trichonephila clavipes]|nr:transposable element Tcb1 transposase [Trichonephila clavipes]